jgi:hypothetical protein
MGPLGHMRRREINRLRWPRSCNPAAAMKKTMLMFVMVLGACGGGDIDKLSKLKDEACACKDKACAEAVNKKMDQTMESMKEPSASDMKKLESIMTEAGVCLAKAMH